MTVLLRFAVRSLLALTVVVGVTAVVPTAAGQDAQPTINQAKLSAFMQAKLEHAQKTLEGLAKEDFELVAKHSQAISILCEDELWAVLKTPEYHQRSKEFQRSVNDITDAARKKNLDAATLAYVDSMMKCVTCHKYVRQTRAPR
jgi:cytochrome c556